MASCRSADTVTGVADSWSGSAGRRAAPSSGLARVSDTDALPGRETAAMPPTAGAASSAGSPVAPPSQGFDARGGTGPVPRRGTPVAGHAKAPPRRPRLPHFACLVRPPARFTRPASTLPYPWHVREENPGLMLQPRVIPGAGTRLSRFAVPPLPSALDPVSPRRPFARHPFRRPPSRRAPRPAARQGRAGRAPRGSEGPAWRAPAVPFAGRGAPGGQGPCRGLRCEVAAGRGEAGEAHVFT